MKKNAFLTRPWWHYAFSQGSFAVSCALGLFAISSIFLHLAQDTRQSDARSSPEIQQRLERENDTSKLRKQANEFWTIAADRGETLEMVLRLYWQFSLGLGAIIVLNAVVTSLVIRRIQSEAREQQQENRRPEPIVD